MSGLQIKYKELFRLSVGQDFYQNGICGKYTSRAVPDILFVPTEETESLMRKMDILYREDDHAAGCVLLVRVSGNTGGGNDLLRFKATPEDKLSFYSYLRNPSLISFNELPVTQDNNSLYYFSNQRTDPAAPRDNLHLTVSAAGVNASADRVKKSGSDYRFHHVGTVAPGTAFVEHILSGRKAAAKSIINQGGQSDLLFDLLVLPAGKCRLLIAAVVQEEFYYLAGLFSPVFAVVEVLLSQTLPVNYRVVENDHSLRPDRPLYTIRFVKRRTLWRYTVSLAANSPVAKKMQAMNALDKAIYLGNLAIVTNDSAISFTQQSASDEEIVFVSSTKLALQENYISSSSLIQEPLLITLKENTGQLNETILRSSLAYPSVISIDARNPPDIYSDILITL